MSDDNKIERQPEYDALYAFDNEHDIEPTSTVAERIAAKYGFPSTHAIVDDIHYALEDAWELGQMRGRLIPPRHRTAETCSLKAALSMQTVNKS